MAEWVLQPSVTIAPEHLGDRHRHLGAGFCGMRHERIGILNVEMDR